MPLGTDGLQQFKSLYWGLKVRTLTHHAADPHVKNCATHLQTADVNILSVTALPGFNLTR